MNEEERNRLVLQFENDPISIELLKARGVSFSHPKHVKAQSINNNQYLIANEFTSEQIGTPNQFGFKLIDEWWAIYSAPYTVISWARYYAVIEDIAQ